MKIVSVKKFLMYFYGFDMVLLLLVVAVFAPRGRKNMDSSSSRTESLVSAEKKDSIGQIDIDIPFENKKIMIKKMGSFWMGTDSDSHNQLIWPADKKRVEGFINVLTEPVYMEKKAGNESSLKKFALDSASAVKVDVMDSRHGLIESLYFGSSDDLTSTVFYRTWKDKTVWAIPEHISVYLSDAQNWADPLIFPEFMGYSKEESGSSLRKGKMIYLTPPSALAPDEVLVKDLGNGGRCEYKIYKKDDEFIVIPSFTSPLGCDEVSAKAIKSVNYRYSVSEWTLEKIRNECN